MFLQGPASCRRTFVGRSHGTCCTTRFFLSRLFGYAFERGRALSCPFPLVWAHRRTRHAVGRLPFGEQTSFSLANHTGRGVKQSTLFFFKPSVLWYRKGFLAFPTFKQCLFVCSATLSCLKSSLTDLAKHARCWRDPTCVRPCPGRPCRFCTFCPRRRPQSGKKKPAFFLFCHSRAPPSGIQRRCALREKRAARMVHKCLKNDTLNKEYIFQNPLWCTGNASCSRPCRLRGFLPPPNASRPRVEEKKKEARGTTRALKKNTLPRNRKTLERICPLSRVFIHPFHRGTFFFR